MEVCREYADPARDAIDVGANIGFYSVLLADHLRDRRVLAIEPTPAALQRLRRNLSMNGCDEKVLVFAGAAGAVNGTVSISTVPGREEYSTAGTLAHPSVSGAVVKTLQIAAQTVDSLVVQHALDPGFIKIDVEGMEHVVIAGMRSTMEKFKPVILAELSDPLLKRNGSSARQVLQQISALGYSVSDPLFPSMSAGARSYGDVLCVPHRK
jgi:FkbM family methyltransferase